MAVSLLGILLLGLFVVAVLAAGVGIAIGLLRRRGGGDATADGGLCGACGYSVRGVSQLSCPECGADLREVGINRAQPRGRSAFAVGCAAAVAAGAFCVIILLMLRMFVQVASPVTRTVPAVTLPATTQPASP